MKSILSSLLLLTFFTTASAQFTGHNKHNIELYFGDMLEQGKWDFDKEYRWSFYICADTESKLQAARTELAQLGFSEFEIIPNSVEDNQNGTMLHMLLFQKSTIYTPESLLSDITAFYTLESNLNLSSFDDYGNYELSEEVSHPTASATAPVF
ncbi:MAG: hypothetical protein POELPBGB_02893 [Bacteroidia bacterium]|nr:hypothetical protein [Bacteroidia bacterium]